MIIKDIYIEKSVYGGYGLGYSHGKAVFVPGTVPGDICDVLVTGEKRDYCFAEVDSIHEKSHLRIEPPCPNFGRCGGCHYLHISYESELLIKKDILIEQCSRIAGIEIEKIPRIDVLSDSRFLYRSHATVKGMNGRAGFFRRDSNEHIALPGKGCLQLADEINQALAVGDIPDGDYVVALDASGKIVNSHRGPSQLRESVNGIDYWRNIDTFFQANRYLRPVMQNLVSTYAIKNPGYAMDIGCGVGFFAIDIASVCEHVTGFDINKDCIRWARLNAKRNDRKNTEFHAISASRINPGRFRPDILIADPPRHGLSRKARNTIIGMIPKIIIYISCNPSTFARDCRSLIESGYRVSELTMIDMFPCTYHIETMALLINTAL